MSFFQHLDPDALFASVVTLEKFVLALKICQREKRRADLELLVTNGLPAWFNHNLLPVAKAIADRWGKATIEAKTKA